MRRRSVAPGWSLDFAWLLPAAICAVLAARFLSRPRGMEVVGPVALLDVVLTMATWLAIVLLAAGAGSRLLDILSIRPEGQAFAWLVRGVLGMGVLGTYLTLLGLFGLFTPGAIFLSLGIVALLTGRPITDATRYLVSLPTKLRRLWARSPWLPRLALLALCAVWGMAFIQALTPPWDYDGLMYHLVGPRLFVEASRILTGA